MARGNSVYLSRADKRRISNDPAVQAELLRRARLGAVAFRVTANRSRRTGKFTQNVRVERHRTPKGTRGFQIVAFPDKPGTKDPNAPVPIEMGTRRQPGLHAMVTARAVVKRG